MPRALLSPQELAASQRLRAAAARAGLVAIGCGDTLLVRAPGTAREAPSRLVTLSAARIGALCHHLPAWVAPRPDGWHLVPWAQLTAAPPA